VAHFKSVECAVECIFGGKFEIHLNSGICKSSINLEVGSLYGVNSNDNFNRHFFKNISALHGYMSLRYATVCRCPFSQVSLKCQVFLFFLPT
jgi:hypothetical protein